MNKTIRYVLISAAAAAVSQAAPFLAVGDGAELFATGVLGVRADDNVLLASGQRGSPEKDDIIFDVVPGLELDFGKNAQWQGSVTVQETFNRYVDNKDLDADLFSGDLVTKYDDGKAKANFNVGYHALNQNTADVRGTVDGRLVRRDITSAAASGEVVISEIASVGAGLTYSHENYHPINYVDSDTTTLPINFYYKWTPKLDLSAGFQYRNYQVQNRGDLRALNPTVDPRAIGPNSQDYFYNIGARGEFTPKLTGKVAVGYTQRKTSYFPNRDLLGVDSSLAFEVSPKTTLQAGLSNDFGTSPQGEQQKNLTANLLASTKLTEQWSANAGISYRGISYGSTATRGGRNDDYWEGTLGAAYVLNANIRLVGAYVYRTYKSDLASSEFDNNVFSIAANLRY